MQDKVSVGFYEESLCPYCAQFTTKVAAPLFENGLSDYIDFDLVPYGNAKNTSEVGVFLDLNWYNCFHTFLVGVRQDVLGPSDPEVLWQVLVPKAHNGLQGLVCQHGEAECRLNRIFACAIDQARHQETWFPFIACVEGKYGPNIEDSVESCSDAAGLDYPDLRDCATGAIRAPNSLESLPPQRPSAATLQCASSSFNSTCMHGSHRRAG